MLPLLLDHLSQQDIVNLSMTTKQSSYIYPESVTKRFAEDATLEQYARFCRAVAKHACVLNLTIWVNPLLWNRVARQYLKKRQFNVVNIFPIHISMMDKSCYCPESKGIRYGFLRLNFNRRELGNEDTTVKYQHMGTMVRRVLELTNHRDDGGAQQLPFLLCLDYFDNPSHVTLFLNGYFTSLGRIPKNLYCIKVNGLHLKLKCLQELTSLTSKVLDIAQCTIDDDCLDATLDHARVTVSGDALRYFKAFADDVELVVEFDEVLPSVTRVYEEIEKMVLARPKSNSFWFSLDELNAFMQRVFPNAERVEYV